MNHYSERDPLDDPNDSSIGWQGEDSVDRPRWSDPLPPPSPPSSRQGFRPEPVGRKRKRGCGCLAVLLAFAILFVIYLLLPFDTRVVLLGTDSRDPEIALGRTDTMIMTSVNPLEPEVVFFSIPRDLWVNIPGYGENRVNAAYFFAEAENPGSGVDMVKQTLAANFGVEMDYYALFKFAGIVDVIDAMGGIDIDLPRAMSGYEEGPNHLDGIQALAFVRDRAGSDDFFRMERGQIFIRSVIRSFSSPAAILRTPFILLALPKAIETDVPVWMWPRMGVALLRAGEDGIRGETMDRDMAVPFVTAQGASVLLPNWDLIWPVINELFE